MKSSLFVSDPAFPGFWDAKRTNESLDASDADFVDVIHTCSGLLGHYDLLGDAGKLESTQSSFQCFLII